MRNKYEFATNWDYRDMKSLPTVLLKHTNDEGSHFDWLLGVPGGKPEAGEAEARLWTFTITKASNEWKSGDEIEVVRNFDHRAKYLTYEGEISGGRGDVERVDEGVHFAIKWGESRIVINVEMKEYQGVVKLVCLGGKRWIAYFKD